MIRMLILRLVLFLVPFGLYAAYLFLAYRGNAQRPATPWTVLFIAGLLLVVGSFFYTGLVDKDLHQGAYVPPHAVNGKIVPGHFSGDNSHQ
jgi:hypothetical protein